MSEPRAVATATEEVLPGVHRWWVADERIGGVESDAYAVTDHDGRAVLIDPLPLADEPLAALGPVAAIVLTAACHQRSAWRLRRLLGAPVHLPEGSRPTAEEPDARYREGDLLPGGLRAIRTPGPEQAHYALLREGDPAVLFVADLVLRGPGGLSLVPAEYHEDPAQTRASIRRLVEEPVTAVCLAHGGPVPGDARAALRELLDREPA
jgi:glyoxylase-like metal-dependent hydrolase (beta-lactamase superfamily II)